MNQKPEMFEGRIVRTVRSLLKDGDILQAIKVTRQWLVSTGRGDSFARAKQIVEDVERDERWVDGSRRKRPDPVHQIMVALAARGRYGSPAYEQARDLWARHQGDLKAAKREASAMPVLTPIPITPPKNRLPAGAKHDH